MAPSWSRIPGLPWSTSEVKSTLQKLIRRRDPRAYTATHWMFRTGGDPATALMRRLPIIALEEGVPAALPDAMDLLSKWSRQTTRHEVTEEAVFRLVSHIMGTPRDKDPTYLVDYMLVRRATFHSLTPFDAAIKRGQAEDAVSHVTYSWSTDNAVLLSERVIPYVTVEPYQRIVKNILRRARFGMSEGDYYVTTGWSVGIASRLAVGSEPVVYDLQRDPNEVVSGGPMPEMHLLPWWGLDAHTMVGKGALNEVRHGPNAPTYARAFITWFMLESDVVEGVVEREGWRRGFLDTITPEEQAWWAAVRPRVQALVEEAVIKTRAGFATPSPLAVKDIGAGRFRVSSETTPGLTYLVVHGGALLRHDWRCECPAFTNRKNGPCKHIRAVMAHLERTQKQPV